MELNWSTPDEAKKWPEGAIVLIRRLDRDLAEYNGVEVVKHFRPDWVGNPNGYGTNQKVFCDITAFSMSADPVSRLTRMKRIARRRSRILAGGTVG